MMNGDHLERGGKYKFNREEIERIYRLPPEILDARAAIGIAAQSEAFAGEFFRGGDRQPSSVYDGGSQRNE